MATSGTFQVGDRVTCNGRPFLGVGVVTVEENYGEILHVRWGNGKGSLPHARGALTKCAGPLLAATGEWERVGCSSRAFVRLGEWEEDAVSYFRTEGGSPCHHAYSSAEKAEVDAELVASGALDPSRAFKAGPVGPSVNGGPLLLTGATGGAWGVVSPWPDTATRMPPEKYNSEPAWSYPGPGVRTTVKPLGGSGYVIPEGHSLDDIARKINADTRAPITATVANGAIRVEPVREGTAKPAWGEWEACGGPVTGFKRRSMTSARVVYACGESWTGFDTAGGATDIDDAREKADAFLVARGELEAGRAFKRVGDWEQGPAAAIRLFSSARIAASAYPWKWFAYQPSGPISEGYEEGAAASADGAKAAADAELVRRGLLAEERAFKVSRDYAAIPKAAGGAFAFKGIAEFDTYTLGPSAVGICEVSHDDGVTWESAQAGVTLGPKSRLRYKASPRSLTGTPTMQPGTYREIVFAEPCVTDQTTVTLANWERCLPRLLSDAPREFRDGFNRKQGPAWEAYLVALAGVKERIQCKRFPGGATVATAIEWAKLDAHDALGAEWVKANVR